METAAARESSQPDAARPVRKAPGNSAAPGKPAQVTPSTPQGHAVKDLIRALGIAEKNYQLYPIHGRVVEQSLAAMAEALKSAFQAAESPIELHVTQQDLHYAGEVVYHEEARAKSIANRLYTDTVRKLSFSEGATVEELTALLSCFREARDAGEDGDDFSTIFWAKETRHISIETAEDFTTEEALAILPVSIDSTTPIEPEKLKLSDSEERSLREALANRPSQEQDGDSTFELTPEELAQIQGMIAAEEEYFPMYDFIDLLLEHMARSQDSKGFQGIVKVVASILEKMIGSFDFEHAMGLMARLSEPKGDTLSEQQRVTVQAVSQGLCNKQTFLSLSSFLKETSHLPKDHDVFRFMRSLGREALPHLCGLLAYAAHAPAVSEVLIAIGSGCGEVFSQFLMNEDPQIVRSMVQVILKTDRTNPVERVAAALRHPDEGVRIHTAKTLLDHGDVKAAQQFVQLLKGDSRPLANLAIQFFAKLPSPGAFEDLRWFIESKKFVDLDTQRQEQVFRALMLANPSAALRYFSEVVLRWRITLGKVSARKKTAALRALAIQPKEGAIALLERFSSSKNGALGPVARRVLDVIQHESPAGRKSANLVASIQALEEEVHV